MIDDLEVFVRKYVRVRHDHPVAIGGRIASVFTLVLVWWVHFELCQMVVLEGAAAALWCGTML
jgi:hypothetical protein